MAIIGDSYSIIKHRQDPNDKEAFDGAPSEKRVGKITPLTYQVRQGLKRRLSSLFPIKDAVDLSKEKYVQPGQGLGQGQG